MLKKRSFTELFIIGGFVVATISSIFLATHWSGDHFHEWTTVNETTREAGVVLGRREHLTVFTYKCNVCGREKTSGECSDLF